MRDYPALTITFASSPDQDRLDQVLAMLDDYAPAAIEETVDGLRAFFASTESRDAALGRLGAAPDLSATPISVSDEDWAARSQAGITPVVIGKLTVAPPWTVTDELRASAPGPVIVIQPSMGFGTGHHASTRLCLSFLQQIPLDGKSVVDVGTGSGVLAIAASVLGAERVVGVDVDADALENARENAELNGLAGRIEFRQQDFAAGISETFNVIVANLTGGLLSRSACQLANLAEPSATLIVSGIQLHEFGDVSGELELCGWTPQSDLAEQGWVGAAFSSPPKR